MIKNKRGATLIEALVASAITAGVLVGVLSLFNLGTSLTQEAGNRSRAINLAQGKMEEILENEYDQIRISDYPQVKATNVGMRPGQMRTEVTGEIDGKKIKVTVTWQDNHGNLTEFLETFVISPY